ncbi:MAG TPA: hypothetical protein VFP92_10720 [Rhodanobacteraceae bacterium]|nr:hypothetical protein [Rhodanobacteraceae bacterium]
MIDDVMNRTKVKRGEELPQSKLSNLDVLLIRQAVEERTRLRREASQLSNFSLARKFGVHTHTIERIVAGEAWACVP